ncbi:MULTISPECIES: M48 family metallopeptidase [Corallincola]|uniref:M48 family peptidase n=3 Tax=Corallincola TaxID=1775176 RepID=A0A368NFS7_9GAMM|nr:MULTISPECIES: M48 family metallopeptidase [Corallincola]RCU48773.1 M48 family peptidase [Corallincola holothuriorum]TAA42670.1 M48 family peptidase [Corallincola spongiicola]TCI01679.1 M48 family peptidase [Corallincola luteus]
MSISITKSAVSLCAIAVLAACTASPTGRDQILLYSDQEMSSLGGQSFEQIKQQEKISGDSSLNRYVQCVARHITAQVPQQYHQAGWEVVVFDSEQANAFALPGGKIGVYTGLLKIAQNQDQLAAVIGHEVGHVMADHSNERLTHNQLAGVTMAVAGAAIAASDSDDSAMWMAALGLGVQVGVMLPYSRTQESESDVIGLDLMAQAGFDPTQSVALWRNMAKASSGQPPEFFSTHPSHDTRIADLESNMSRAQGIAAKAHNKGLNPKCRL